MKIDQVEYRKIDSDQWLPDRCLSMNQPFDPKSSQPEAGCPSLSWYYTKINRHILEGLYQEVIGRFGCCGFVAWQGNLIVGFHNFFPRELANRVKFYGWGKDQDEKITRTLVHNCISIVNSPFYRRKHIGTNLIQCSLEWGKQNKWERFVVHNVLPDNEKAFHSEQKSCVTFWRNFGFKIYRKEKAVEGLREKYGIKQMFSLYKELQ